MDATLTAMPLLQSAAFEGVRNMLIFAHVGLALLIIIFVLFRQTDSQGLAGAFGGAGGGGGGEGAFGAKTQKVADKVIAWMCGLFLVLSLLIATISTEKFSSTVGGDGSTVAED